MNHSLNPRRAVSGDTKKMNSEPRHHLGSLHLTFPPPWPLASTQTNFKNPQFQTLDFKGSSCSHYLCNSSAPHWSSSRCGGHRSWEWLPEPDVRDSITTLPWPLPTPSPYAKWISKACQLYLQTTPQTCSLLFISFSDASVQGSWPLSISPGLTPSRGKWSAFIGRRARSSSFQESTPSTEGPLPALHPFTSVSGTVCT